MCMSCGGSKSATKKIQTASGKNAPNPFKASAGIKIGKATSSFGTAKVKTNFKIGR